MRGEGEKVLDEVGMRVGDGRYLYSERPSLIARS